MDSPNANVATRVPPLPANAGRQGPLQFLYNTFARDFSTTLSAQLRHDFDFQLQSMERCYFGELIESFQNPACLAIFKVEPLGTPMLVEIDPQFAKRIVELLLGGQIEEHPYDTEANLTVIEQHLFADILELIGSQLRRTLSRVADYSFVFEQIETAPQMLRVLTAKDLVDLIAFEIRADGAVWPMRLYQPTGIADGPGSDRTDIGPDNGADADEGILAVIGSSQIEFEALLCGPQVSLADLASLEPGDVLHLSNSRPQHMVATVNGLEHFRGQVVNQRNHRAFMIEAS